MSEKPQKRLVSKGQYVRTMGSKTVLYSLAGGVFVAGLLLLTLTLVGVFQFHDLSIVFLLAPGAVAIAGLVCSRNFFKEAKEIEPVQLLTIHNRYLMPPKQSLVRASDPPPSQQRAELLRAAGQGPQTPAEVLLRATTREE
jgi:hypothetical protein